MAQTHTPGPWKIAGEFADVSVVNVQVFYEGAVKHPAYPLSMVLIFDADGNVVCEIEPFTEEWTVGEVFKTHLIAAAPELLDACQTIERILVNRVRQLPDPKEMIRILRAAIEKAEKAPLARTEGQSPKPTSEGSAKE